MAGVMFPGLTRLQPRPLRLAQNPGGRRCAQINFMTVLGYGERWMRSQLMPAPNDPAGGLILPPNHPG
jgi:hypothetical protein